MMVDEYKLAPHCIEAEEAVLGSIIVDSSCLSDVKAIISAEDFYDERHRFIFEAMESLGEGIDQLTVAQELKKMGKVEEAGGLAYLSRLVSILPTSVHACYYADIVRARGFDGRVITTAGKIAAMAYEGKGDRMELYVRAQEALAKLEPQDRHEIVGPQEHAELMLDMLSRRQGDELDCVPFGYRDLDDLTGGMYGGDFCIIGARPSVGKSQLLLEVALHNARTGLPVLVASAEMSLRQLAEREIVMATGIDIRRLRKGRLSESDWEDAQSVVAEASNMPLYFLAGSLNITSIAQKAKLLKQTKGLALVVVDYIQLLRDRSDKRAGDNLRERIGYISSGLKNIARDLDIPVLAASQFSRQVEMRPDHKPMLADLKESGDLEQDADVVLLLHRPELYDPNRDKGILEIKVAKSRQLGIGGVVKLVWVEKEHRYRDIVR